MNGAVLLVDDDASVAALIKSDVTKAGYSIHHAKNADSGFAHLVSEKVDLAILDIQLPGISGLALLEMIKKDPRTAKIPVIMLTLRGEEEFKLQGLRGGADDYLVKPFSTKELIARIEAVLRRTRHEGRMDPVLEVDSIRIEYEKRLVKVNGKTIELTGSEFDLLALVARRPGHVFTYAMISDHLSTSERILNSENIHVHVKNLRRKLGSRRELIETVYGIGYRFAE